MKKQSNYIDRTSKKCKCGGKFVETSIFDDMHGFLHCNKCNKRIKRYKMRDSK